MDKVPTKNCKSSKVAANDHRPLSITDHLPYEIVLNILSRLPIKSLLQAKLVSRSWKNLVRDPVLAHLHCSRMYQKNPSLVLRCNYPLPTKFYFLHDIDSIENGEGLKRIILPRMLSFVNVAGSCRGLICIYDLLRRNAIYVFNPFTGQYLELRKAEKFTKYDDVSFGFGFLPTTKQYKVVRVVYHSITKSDVQIFNIGGSSWRSVGPTTHILERGPSHALVNTRLHWLTLEINQEPLRIVSFDLEDEQFRIVPEPDCIFISKDCPHLVILNGCLSLATVSAELQLDIWIMKEYDVKESWTKSFSIGGHYLLKELIQHEVQSFIISDSFIDPTYIRGLCMLENGKILLNNRRQALLLYEPNSSILEKLMLPESRSFFQSIVHISSLNCIDSMTI